MIFKIGAFGYGLAAILGVGSIMLAVLGKDNWEIFLAAAIFIWIFSTIIRKI